MNIQTLENQSWALVCKLNKIIEVELAGHYVRYSTPQMKKRLYLAHANAYERFKRRQSKLFNFHSGGFALPSAQPSDAVGQVATINCLSDLCEHYCSDCADFNCCVNCDCLSHWSRSQGVLS